MTPPIFCITCRRTPERWKQTQAHLVSVGLDVTPFYGIHGQTMGLRTAHPLRPGWYITAGQVGCFLSHYMLWQTLTFLPHEEVLILEDDAFVEPDFQDRFAEAYADLPEDWQLAFVGSINSRNLKPQQLTPRVAVLEYPYATHSYMIRRSALPVLLETNQRLYAPLDVQLIEHALPRLKVYTFWPSLVRQRTYENQWLSMMGGERNPPEEEK